MSPATAFPLRILHLSTPKTAQPALFRDAEAHEISTPYYSASIPIWRDSLPTTTASISAWKEEWSTSEAGEVVQAVGAWVLCFRKARVQEDLNTLRTVLSTIHEVIEHHSTAAFSVNEPLLLAVGMEQSMSPSLEVETEEWEDLCRECGGWEWIDGTLESGMGTDQKKKVDEEQQEDMNEYGEKLGMARLKEALEAHEWDSPAGNDFEDLDDLGLDVDDAELGFGEEAMEAQMEMWGLQSAVRKEEEEMKEDGEEEEEDEEKKEKKDGNVEGQHTGDEVADQDVQELEAMMLKMQAFRDMGSDMPEPERKRFAVKAVREVLREKK